MIRKVLLATILLLATASCGTSPTTCKIPRTEALWPVFEPKNVTFDKCTPHTFTHNGTTFTILFYYTLTESDANKKSCTDAAYPSEFCEHQISSEAAVAPIASLIQQAIIFYRDHNFKVLEPDHVLHVLVSDNVYEGDKEVQVLTSQDNPNRMYWDDERFEGTTAQNVLDHKRLAFHEVQHLVQFQYNDLVDLQGGLSAFFAEGIATAIEDRVHTDMDTGPGARFQTYFDEMMLYDFLRTTDLATQSYPSMAWWTWVLDQYRDEQTESEPATGYIALQDLYLRLSQSPDEWTAIRQFILAHGSNFEDDFIDYTLALYAYRYNPKDPRLGFLDNEINTQSPPFTGHTILPENAPFATEIVDMQPRSSRYWEFYSAQPCEYTAFTFNGLSKPYGFSVLGGVQGNLLDRWTSYGKTWALAVHSLGSISTGWHGYDRVTGVVTGLNDSGPVIVGRGCVSPEFTIKDPLSETSTRPAKQLGTADNPHKFIVRLHVTAGNAPLAGLQANEFTVQLTKVGGGPALPATVVSAVYVQDDYWLLVQPPDAAAGAETGAHYDLTVAFGSLSATEPNAVQYIELLQEVMLVFDHSDSMNNNDKITAARNAANFLVNELADDDRAGLVIFNNIAELPEGAQLTGLSQLVQIDPQTEVPHRQVLEQTIAAVEAFEWTTIGGGMELAAQQFDDFHQPQYQCSFVLLSDGQETSPPGWINVYPNVIDNGCPTHSIALGPEANEFLMASIASMVPGGSYDYADSAGNPPIAKLPKFDAPIRMIALPAESPAALTNISWQNNLSRVYDNKATQIAHRQRIQAFGEGDNGEYQMYVDDLAEQLVIGLAWQDGAQPPGQVELYDPNGSAAVAVRRASSLGTNEVWTVEDPTPGHWTLLVNGISQEYIVTASVLSHYELYLFAGTPVEDPVQGAQVPILAAFVGKDAPITGAAVTAKVIAPDGSQKVLTLYDDGNHLDAAADDGVYGNLYTATSLGETAAAANPIENQEPQSVGSYRVLGLAVWNSIRREAQTSFALAEAEDLDGDGLPDVWEAQVGIDSPAEDPDGDGLNNGCEFQLGTEPNNADTDGGGESDGSEADCDPGAIGRDPLDPGDDLVGPLTFAVAMSNYDGQAFVSLTWGQSLQGELAYVDAWRRVISADGSASNWDRIASRITGYEYLDRNVEAGTRYQYRVVPVVLPATVSAVGLEFHAGVIETGIVEATNEPVGEPPAR